MTFGFTIQRSIAATTQKFVTELGTNFFHYFVLESKYRSVTKRGAI